MAQAVVPSETDQQKKEMIAAAAFVKATMPDHKIVGAERLSEYTMRVDMVHGNNAGIYPKKVTAVTISWEVEAFAENQAKDTVAGDAYALHKALLDHMLAEYEQQIGHKPHPDVVKAMKEDPVSGIKALEFMQANSYPEHDVPAGFKLGKIDPETYVCQLCPYFTIHKKNAQAHSDSGHPNGYGEKKLPLSFITNPSGSAYSYSCAHCVYQTSSIDNAKIHHFQQIDDPSHTKVEKKYWCGVCQKESYFEFSALTVHAKMSHGVIHGQTLKGTKPGLHMNVKYTCVVEGCGWDSLLYDAVQKHAEQEHGMYFDLDTDTWNLSSKLPDGFEYKSGSGTLVCKKCKSAGKTYKVVSKSAAIIHSASHKLDPAVPVNFKSPAPKGFKSYITGDGDTFVCQKCGFTAFSVVEADNHTAAHHSSPSGNIKITTPTITNSHIITTNPYQNYSQKAVYWQVGPLDPEKVYAQDGTGCHICGYVSKDMETMVAHAQAHIVNSETKKAPPFICDVTATMGGMSVACEYEAETMDELNQHIMDKHIMDSITCSVMTGDGVCNLSFETIGQLNQHIMDVHYPKIMEAETSFLKKDKNGNIDYSAPATKAVDANGEKPPLPSGKKDVVIAVQQDGQYYCTECTSTLFVTTKDAVLAHVEKVHPGANVSITTSPFPTKSFSTKKKLFVADSEVAIHPYQSQITHPYQSQINEWMEKLNSIAPNTYKFGFEYEPGKTSRVVKTNLVANTGFGNGRSVHAWVTVAGEVMSGSWTVPDGVVDFQLGDPDSFKKLLSKTGLTYWWMKG